MEIIKGVKVIGLCLYLKKSLIISDIHMGFEESLNKSGILIPMKQFNDTIKELDIVFNNLRNLNLKVEQIIINGDLKHEFGKISKTEWKHTLNLLDYLLEHAKKIVLIKGNHDTMLEPIAKKRNIEVRDYVVINNILVCHGDVVLKKPSAKYIIIGHEHPAITLRDNSKIEKFKCYLKGKWKDKVLIVMPSFNLVVEGSDVLREERLSPYLQGNITNFQVYVYDETSHEVLNFGTLQRLAKFC